ncbi:uncharacterized protein K441DRAFT_571163, partial [Cenococcum geophilum 1.58]|uniref:uncharacterized protein n=1 Tax=Cenococcum geophilum 1.58 TaxID=794803 RepID=UPI00358DE7BA
ALLKGVADIFDEYIYCIIRRVTVLNNRVPAVKAAIIMQFPSFALYNYIIMLEIYKSEVEHLVKDLFGINLILHLILKKDIKLISNISNPKIILKGIKNKTIIYILGAKIYKAIIASWIRIRELKKERNSAIECMSIIFIYKSSEGAYINIYLLLKEGL